MIFYKQGFKDHKDLSVASESPRREMLQICTLTNYYLNLM